MFERTVGLTGGIASGKSTVAGFFRNLGVPIVDADALAREVVAVGSEGLREIVEAFGSGALSPDGTLDRKALGARVFADPAARARLNAITHPRIAALGDERVTAHLREGADYVIYEAALLVENGLGRAFTALVVAAVRPETQLLRLMTRDGFRESEALARIQAQAKLEDKVSLADFVIWNDGTLEETRAQTEAVHRALVQRMRGVS